MSSVDDNSRVMLHADPDETLRRWFNDTLIAGANLAGLQAGTDPNLTENELLCQTRAQIARSFNFDVIDFAMVDEDSNDFVFPPCAADPALAILRNEVDRRIEDGHFAWTLGQTRPVLLPALDRDRTLLLCTLATRNRVRGMFMGLLGTRAAEVSEATLNLLFMILAGTANALESISLYRLVRQQNQDLERRVEERTRELDAMRHRAEAANLAKSTFLANMSHEIRTPLSGVIGMLDLLANSPLTAAQRDFIATARDSGQALLALINGILDLSKIEAGRAELERLEFDVCELAESVCTLFSAKAFEKSLELICRVDPGIPARIVSDPTRLRQILSNLLGNAIKFTDTGTISLTVAMEAHAAAGAWLRIAVADTGIGIPHDAREDIFEPFGQADSSTTRRYGGTGLGLTISKKLIELFGGTLTLDSRLDRGSTFTLRIPVVLTGDAARRPAARPAPLAKRNIVILSGNPCLAETLSGYLQDWGAAVRHLDSPASLRAGAFAGDILLFDTGPPNPSAACTPSLDDIPDALAAKTVILAATGQAPAGPDAGPMGYLGKPVRRGVLLRELLIRLGETAGSAADTRATPAQDAATALPRSRILVAEDNPVNKKVVTHFLADLGMDFEVVETGRAAVDAATARHWDLILMDCQMPVLDGFEATREIRARQPASGRPRVPIIALTANALAGDREKCLAAGMDDYLTKPIQQEQLRRALLRWLTGCVAVSSPAAGERHAASDLHVIDWRVLDDLHAVVGTETADILRTFFAATEEALADIAAAAHPVDFERLYARAHNLKATAGSVGAIRLQQLALELETCTRAGGCATIGALVSDLKESYRHARQALADWLQRQDPAGNRGQDCPS